MQLCVFVFRYAFQEVVRCVCNVIREMLCVWKQVLRSISADVVSEVLLPARVRSWR